MGAMEVTAIPGNVPLRADAEEFWPLSEGRGSFSPQVFRHASGHMPHAQEGRYMSRQVSLQFHTHLQTHVLQQDCNAAVSETPMPKSRIFSRLFCVWPTGAGGSLASGADRVTEDSQSSGRRYIMPPDARKPGTGHQSCASFSADAEV